MIFPVPLFCVARWVSHLHWPNLWIVNLPRNSCHQGSLHPQFAPAATEQAEFPLEAHHLTYKQHQGFVFDRLYPQQSRKPTQQFESGNTTPKQDKFHTLLQIRE